jgi:hypothetical protein
VVENADGTELMRPGPLALDEADIQLFVPLTLATPGAADWTELAERAEETRRIGVHEIVAGLTTGNGVFADSLPSAGSVRSQRSSAPSSNRRACSPITPMPRPSTTSIHGVGPPDLR